MDVILQLKVIIRASETMFNTSFRQTVRTGE